MERVGMEGPLFPVYARSENDRRHPEGVRQLSSRSLMNQNRPGYPPDPHYPHHQMEQDRRLAAFRQTSSHSLMNQSQIRPGVPNSASQLGYRQQYPSGVTSNAGYTLTGGPPQRGQSRERSVNLEVPQGLAEEHISILLGQGFSAGLAKALVDNTQSFHHRVWVVDNSGSMQIGDGHRVNNGKILPVTRWAEIQDTVLYHSQMAAVLKSFTIFRLLNYPGQDVGQKEFTVAEYGGDIDKEIKNARMIMTRTKPDGVTPLTAHIWEIQAEIRQILPQLQRSGKRIAVILATDGLPTDEQGYGGDDITMEFIRALRGLEGLPIWLVIRLCTDEENVTSFYNQLDGMLELSLEVLDDFLGECKEVQKQNPWLNYALPMHRCRELGYHDRLFDLIDERPLTKGELRDFCVLLFGTDYRTIPDPVVDWKGFLKYVKAHLSQEMPQWNPLTKKTKPWVSINRLNRIYGGGACSVM